MTQTNIFNTTEDPKLNQTDLPLFSGQASSAPDPGQLSPSVSTEGTQPTLFDLSPITMDGLAETLAKAKERGK
jgi:hypothetical protein